MTEPRDIIAALPREQHDPRLAGLRATYRFVIEDAGVYLLRIDDGRLEILEEAGDAATTLTCSADDFKDVILGEQNLITAVLQGRIELDGDVKEFFVFHQLLRIRQKERGSAGVTP